MDSFEEIKALKSLLDEGLLTQEEYNAKKDELLGFADTAENVTPPEGLVAPRDAWAAQSSLPDASSSNDDSVDVLRQYKALLDEGVLTQGEFEAKKAKLLGIKPSVKLPTVDAEAVDRVVEKAREKLPGREQVKAATEKGRSVVRGGVKRFASVSVTAMCIFQVLVCADAVIQIDLMGYLARQSFACLLSPDLMAGLLFLVATLLCWIASHSQSRLHGMLKSTPLAGGKKMLAASVVLGVAATVLLMYARSGGTLFGQYYFYAFDFVMLFFIISCLLAFVAAALGDK